MEWWDELDSTDDTGQSTVDPAPPSYPPVLRRPSAPAPAPSPTAPATPSAATLNDDPGFLTKSFANPWVSLPFIAGSALLGAASPTGARAASLINTGLGLGMNVEQYGREQRQKQRLSEALAPVINAQVDKPVMKTGLDPTQTTFATPDTRMASTGGELPPTSTLSDYAEPLAKPAPLPQYLGTQKGYAYPEATRNLMGALVRSGNPELAAKTLDTLAAQKLAPPPAPHFGRQGQQAVYNPDTNRWEITPGTGVTGGAPHIIQTPEGTFRVPTTMGAPAEQVEGITGKTAPEPPALTDALSIAIEGKVNRGVALNRRELDALGVDNPEQAKAVVREMAKIKEQRQVDTKNAMLAAIAAFKAEHPTVKEVKNPSDWLRYNQETGDVETAPGDITQEELKSGGYREIKSLKDRQAITGGSIALDTQFQKVLANAEEFKKTSALSLLAGKYSGGNVGSTAGATMEGAARQMIQFLEKNYGGARAASSKPLLDAASGALIPTEKDSPAVVDIKMKGLEVLVEGLKDLDKRAAFNLGINPKVKTAMDQYIKLVKGQGVKERGEKPSTPAAKPATPRKTGAETRYNELKKGGMADADIYKKLASEGY